MTDSQERDPKRAIAYLRCSSRTNEGGDTFKRQEAAVRSYADRQGIDLVAVYRDVVSGKSELQDRGGLSEAMSRIRHNHVGTVLVESPSRLARDSLVHHLLVAKLVEMGVRVVDSTGLDLGDTNDPTGKLVASILAALSAFERECIVARLRGARDRKRETEGRCEGVKPYGVTEQERECIKRMRALRKLRGGRRLSWAKVAARLNAEGWPTRSGRPWAAGSCRKICSRRLASE